MTDTEIKDGIKVGIPSKDSASADAIAAVYLKKSVLKIGRMKGVHWNRTDVTFTLTAGKSLYLIGVDILSTFPELKNMQTIHITDSQRAPIPIVDVQEFSRRARGSTASGVPIVATLHSDEITLEFWPSPDSNYPMWGYVRKKIVNLDDIPEEYHDVVIDFAIASLGAAEDKRVAVEFARSGLKDIQDDALTEWSENVIPLRRHLADDVFQVGGDSGNLRGG